MDILTIDKKKGKETMNILDRYPKLRARIEENYNITEYDNVLEFQRYSSVGQDFIFNVDTQDDIDMFCENIYRVYSDFDVDEEVTYWIGEDGHGKNGAPYRIRDIIADMEECEGFILELYYIVSDYINETKADV